MNNEFDGCYIRIPIVLGIDAKLIHVELTAALGPNTSSYPTVPRWAKRFHKRREDVNDEHRFGRPVSELTDVNIELG